MLRKKDLFRLLIDLLTVKMNRLKLRNGVRLLDVDLRGRSIDS